MDDRENPETEDTEGNLARRTVSDEGTEDENAEGHSRTAGKFVPEGTDDDAEGQGRAVSAEGEDDAEGHWRR